MVLKHCTFTSDVYWSGILWKSGEQQPLNFSDIPYRHNTWQYHVICPGELMEWTVGQDGLIKARVNIWCDVEEKSGFLILTRPPPFSVIIILPAGDILLWSAPSIKTHLSCAICALIADPWKLIHRFLSMRQWTYGPTRCLSIDTLTPLRRSRLFEPPYPLCNSAILPLKCKSIPLSDTLEAGACVFPPFQKSLDHVVKGGVHICRVANGDLTWENLS